MLQGSMLQGGTLRAATLLVFLLAAACGDRAPATSPTGESATAAPVVDLGAEPVPLDLGHVAAIVTPPSGRWRHRAESQAPGQWYAEYMSEDGRTLMRAFAFPRQTSSDPVAVLMQAVDTFFRSVGVEGFGLPTRKARTIWGAPAADARLSAVVGGVRVDGAARLLLVGPDTWALAIGYAPTEGSADSQLTVQQFAESLEPTEPHFFRREFRSDAKLAQSLLSLADEPALTGGDVAAVLLLLEAGSDRRVPLALQPALRDALVAQARSLPRTGRDAYREAASGFATWATLGNEERGAGLRALGRRTLEALYGRANQGDQRAVRLADLWHRLWAVAIGTPEEGLSVGALANLNEMSAFLAEVAADEVISGQGEAGRALQAELRAELTQRWAGMTAAEKRALAKSDAQWAEVRRAWDRASHENRAVFRRAVAAELAAPAEHETVSALATGRPLMRWMDAQRAPGRGVVLMRRAFELTAAQRAELIGLLGVEPRPFALGW